MEPLEDSGQQRRKSLPEMIKELLDLINTYAREQIRDIVENSATGPLKRAGKAAAMGIVAAFVFGTAAIFLAVALFLLLLEFIKAWAAVGLVGVILVIAGMFIVRGGNK